MLSTQKEILDYLVKQTENFDEKRIKEFSTNIISNELKISRSLASQYLNEFVKEKILIKISSRPVYFFYKKGIEDQFQITLINNVFYSVSEFLHEITKNKRYRHDFMKLIGFDGSLKFCIDQIKTSLRYPPAGLPIILYGENGTGKTLLCKMMNEYAVSNGIIDENEKCVSIEIPEDEKRAIELLNTIEDFNGILCINRAQNLTPECQNTIQLLIEDYVYKSKKINGHIILVMNTIPEDAFNSKFLQCFPVICRTPTLEERSVEEKEELIVHFFKGEAKKINNNIFVSKSVMKILLSIKFKQNIIDLRKTIKTICAKANFNREEKSSKNLYVKLYEMPEDILMNLNDADLINEEKIEYINIGEYKKSDDSEKVIDLFDSIIDRYKDTVKVLKDTEVFMKDVMTDLKQYYEYLVFKKKYSNNRIKAIEHSVNLIVEKVLNMYNVNLPVNCIVIISRIIYMLGADNSVLNIWEKERKQDIQLCLNTLDNYYPNESFIVERINQSIKSNLEFELDNMNKILLILNLSYYNNEIMQCKYLSIIISHGYATASSMADAVNSMLGSYIFDAFDMSLDTSMTDVADKLQRYILKSKVKKDVILLVDMGSLEDMDVQISQILNKNIGIINNVSTRLALEAGQLIIQGMKMEDVLYKVSNNCKSVYKIIENESKKGTIIFVSESGLSMANRMKNLFVKSLPCPIDVDIITMDYDEISAKENRKSISKKYNILFISGTFDPNYKDEIFVPIEEIVSFGNIDKIQNELSVYMNPKELETFSQNIIRNFSFENLVGNLTILDVNKLLDFVESTIEQIQMKLGMVFNGRTKVGMYMHMSCLVERLVIKEPIEAREEIEKFKIEQGKFIKIVKESFEKISKHYGVEIPVSEIAYFYDYIMADKNLQ